MGGDPVVASIEKVFVYEIGGCRDSPGASCFRFAWDVEDEIEMVDIVRYSLLEDFIRNSRLQRPRSRSSSHPPGDTKSEHRNFPCIEDTIRDQRPEERDQQGRVTSRCTLTTQKLNEPELSSSI